MKREAINHTKLKRLCRRLDLPIWQAVGLLEMLWHVTSRETPRGDIGKLSDEDIALALDYRGDETALVQALVLSGWIDIHPMHRLIIHDWPDHADDAVNMKLARGRQYFADGTAPKIGRLTNIERVHAEAFYATPCAQTPEPCARRADAVLVPEPEPRQSPAPPEPLPEERTSPASPAEPAIVAELTFKARQVVWFENEFWPAYWRKVSKSEALKVFQKHATSEETKNKIIAAVHAHSPGYCADEPRFRPHAATWLRKRRYEEPFEEASQTLAIVANQPPRRILAEDEKTARVLQATRRAMGEV